MNITKLLRIIRSTQPVAGEKGHLFTVSFIKKDGTPRTMRARLGMQRDLTGDGMAYNPADFRLLTVWSADSQGYRNIPLDRVTEVSYNGESYRA